MTKDLDFNQGSRPDSGGTWGGGKGCQSCFVRFRVFLNQKNQAIAMDASVATTDTSARIRHEDIREVVSVGGAAGGFVGGAEDKSFVANPIRTVAPSVAV